jgi:hypothetical protein
MPISVMWWTSSVNIVVTHHRYRFAPVGRPRLEGRLGAQRIDGVDELVLRAVRPRKPSAHATRDVDVVEVWPRTVEGKLPVDLLIGRQVVRTRSDELPGGRVARPVRAAD